MTLSNENRAKLSISQPPICCHIHVRNLYVSIGNREAFSYRWSLVVAGQKALPLLAALKLNTLFGDAIDGEHSLDVKLQYSHIARGISTMKQEASQIE